MHEVGISDVVFIRAFEKWTNYTQTLYEPSLSVVLRPEVARIKQQLWSTLCAPRIGPKMKILALGWVHLRFGTAKTVSKGCWGEQFLSFPLLCEFLSPPILWCLTTALEVYRAGQKGTQTMIISSLYSTRMDWNWVFNKHSMFKKWPATGPTKVSGSAVPNPLLAAVRARRSWPRSPSSPLATLVQSLTCWHGAPSCVKMVLESAKFSRTQGKSFILDAAVTNPPGVSKVARSRPPLIWPGPSPAGSARSDVVVLVRMAWEGKLVWRCRTFVHCARALV